MKKEMIAVVETIEIIGAIIQSINNITFILTKASELSILSISLWLDRFGNVEDNLGSDEEETPTILSITLFVKWWSRLL